MTKSVVRGLTFVQESDKRVLIMKGDKEIGHIITPSDSYYAADVGDSIQICGFSEAYDYWSCGIYRGFKDIQLFFSGRELGGESTIHNRKVEFMDECVRCYRTPCQCENKHKGTMPFNVKFSTGLIEALDVTDTIKKIEKNLPKRRMVKK